MCGTVLKCVSQREGMINIYVKGCMELIYYRLQIILGFPGGVMVKNLSDNAGGTDVGYPSVFRMRKSQGFIKTEHHEIIKTCPATIVIDPDMSWKILVLKET